MTHPRHRGSTHLCQSRGSALLLGMVLLFALTLLATALAAEHRFQVRVQTNQDRVDDARHRSMTALAEAEDWLRGLSAANRPAPCQETCTSSDRIWQDSMVPTGISSLGLDWWSAHAQATTEDDTTASGPGYWLISEIERPAGYPESPDTPETYYRVIAIGLDPQVSTQFTGEALFLKPWTEPASDAPHLDETGGASSCHPALDPPCGRVAWRRLR